MTDVPGGIGATSSGGVAEEPRAAETMTGTVPDTGPDTGTSSDGSARLELPAIVWRRIAPKYLISEFIGVAVTAIVLLAVTVPLHLIGWGPAPWATGALIVALGAYAAFTPRRVRSIGYQLRDDDLVFRRGILFQRFVAVPYGRMQLIDINRGPLSRLLGLSDLKFVTAAASSGVVIPGLLASDADDLRDRLVALAESRRAGL